MSDKPKQDRRIERTQAALWQALFSLLQERRWQQIDVSSICRRANVARSSFYLHFQNKLELLDYGFETGLRDARADIAARQTVDGDFATLQWLPHHIYSVHGFQQSRIVADSHVFARFQQAFAELFYEELDSRRISVNRDTRTFIVGGIFAVTQQWATSDAPAKPDAFARQLNRYAKALL